MCWNVFSVTHLFHKCTSNILAFRIRHIRIFPVFKLLSRVIHERHFVICGVCGVNPHRWFKIIFPKLVLMDWVHSWIELMAQVAIHFSCYHFLKYKQDIHIFKNEFSFFLIFILFFFCSFEMFYEFLFQKHY